MNRSKWLGLLFSWILLCAQAASGAPQKVVFGVLGFDFPPFQTLVNGTPNGPDFDIVREAFSRMPGYELDIQVMPLKRVQHDIQTGGIDITTLYKSPARLDQLLFPDQPIRWSIYKLAVPAGKRFEFNGIEDLHGRSLGKLESNVISQDFDTAAEHKDFELYELKSFRVMLNMLNLERLEGIVGHAQIIDYVALTMDLQGRIEFLDKPVRPAKEFHIVISPRAQISDPEALRQSLSVSLKSMLDDGTFDAIYDSYGLVFERN
ncbi:substrate-binding periplasmic protein [Aliamphritea hakodatensis]|uniref:substrate-binding periplasmic protein n=1 Tax=Aliamphritea hakodatensis TaxID=2895352 RepID=UPI0022FD7AF5|nr:ABC transporter substrate-binding protein [Aliamphritea hakodatensis]